MAWSEPMTDTVGEVVSANFFNKSVEAIYALQVAMMSAGTVMHSFGTSALFNVETNETTYVPHYLEEIPPGTSYEPKRKERGRKRVYIMTRVQREPIMTMVTRTPVMARLRP